MDKIKKTRGMIHTSNVQGRLRPQRDRRTVFDTDGVCDEYERIEDEELRGQCKESVNGRENE